ncbi:MAG: hypothetical protein E6K80_10905 [Candidatus Eisenbacteria bacterium]|uniref:peptidylprolyl isomerase n=1 Tax=Eiseniibacteriota bacterium TaxID=2212470 RepID=A0A538U1C8_UNCEI|nr:MAG: hypothetical protein E6K80_10905 [Candidatus Eisenbacteria bacterium]
MLLAGVAGAVMADKAPPVYRPPGRPVRASVDYLPDSVVVARVDGKPIRVADFVDRYFNMYPEYRPVADSSGRLEFFNTLMTKEIMAAVARKTKHEETYEDRATIRSYIQRVLGNVLFERTILDSAHVSEQEAQAVYDQMKRELRVSRLRFGSYATAERMRRDLLAGRISQSRAWELRVHIPNDTTSTPDLGWRKRGETSPTIANIVFALPVDGISEPVSEPPGYSLYLIKDERPLAIQPYKIFRGPIMDEVKAIKLRQARERLLKGLRAEEGLHMDSVNVSWTAARFPTRFRNEGTSRLIMDVSLPSIAPEDTGKVVATYRGGKITVGRILENFRETDELMRPSLDSQEGIQDLVDVLILEPRLADIARKRGFDRDPEAVAQIERKKEEIAVEHLFQDSIQARIFIPPAERRKYYKDNETRFHALASSTYALFYIDNKENADTVAARLNRGVEARAIMREDSLKGYTRGHVETQTEEDHGLPFHKKVMEELKEKEVFVYGPDLTGAYNVLQVLKLDPGRKVPYEEVDGQIDSYLQQEASDSLLNAFAERYRKPLRVETHPELLGRINLTPRD